MRVDARDVKSHSSAEHVDFAVGQKVGQVLLHDMGGTVIGLVLRAKRHNIWQQRSCRRVTVLRLSMTQLRACQGVAVTSSLQRGQVSGMSSRGGKPRRRRVTMVVQRSV